MAESASLIGIEGDLPLPILKGGLKSTYLILKKSRISARFTSPHGVVFLPPFLYGGANVFIGVFYCHSNIYNNVNNGICRHVHM